MATSYPGSLDSWSNPTSTTTMDDASFQHDVLHSNHNDAIEAIEGELGTDPAGAFPTVKVAIPGHSWWLAYGGHSYGTHTSGLRYTNGQYPTATTGFTSQRLWVARIVPPESFACTKLFYCQSAVASTVTSAAIGIYSAAGSKLQEADISSVVTSTGIKSVTITSQDLTAGTAYYVAILVDAATPGNFSQLVAMESTVWGVVVGPDSSSPPSAYLTGQTSLPSTLTYSSMTRTAGQVWVGVGA